MKGRDKMAVKKKFPYRAAVVGCNGEGPACADFPCKYGCVGCGNCAAACRFGAIALNERGVAEVDEGKCIGCGVCVKACPQQVIRIHNCANYIVVTCSNQEKGKAAKEVCAFSCIGCGICVRTCTAEAIHLAGNCAVIDEEACLSCGMCAVKCPGHAIRDLRGILTD